MSELLDYVDNKMSELLDYVDNKFANMSILTQFFLQNRLFHKNNYFWAEYIINNYLFNQAIIMLLEKLISMLCNYIFL